MVAAKKADFDAISKQFDIDPVIARIIRNRDIIEMKDIDVFLNGNDECLYSPYLLKDMEKAVTLILEAITQKQKFATALIYFCQKMRR